MKVKLICYPPCSTCKKAEQLLNKKQINYQYQDIKKQPPTTKQLKQYHRQSQLPLKRFFNTSGNSYKELQLAARFDQLTEDELFELLARDGMLIKRPLLLINNQFAAIGFKQETWEALLK